MPTVENTNLTLTTVDGRVTIRVTYDARFTPFERQLADLGMRYHSHVNALGMDPGGDSLTGANLAGVDFPTQNFPVTAGTVDQVLSRDESQTVIRDLLQEDPNSGDADEIRCKIRIHSVGIPPEFTADEFTVEKKVLG
jgi:hypothetical protein